MYNNAFRLICSLAAYKENKRLTSLEKENIYFYFSIFFDERLKYLQSIEKIWE